MFSMYTWTDHSAGPVLVLKVADCSIQEDWQQQTLLSLKYYCVCSLFSVEQNICQLPIWSDEDDLQRRDECYVGIWSNQAGDLKLHSSVDWKTMKLLQHWSDVISLHSLWNEVGSSILHGLYLTYQIVRDSEQ